MKKSKPKALDLANEVAKLMEAPSKKAPKDPDGDDDFAKESAAEDKAEAPKKKAPFPFKKK